MPLSRSMSGADWLRLVLLSVLWGGSFFFVEVAVPALPALTIAWLRVTLAALALAAVLIATGTAFPPPAAFGPLIVMGLLNNALPFTLFATAQAEIASGLAAMLNATTPLFTVIIAVLAGAERMTVPRLGGLMAGIAGVGVLTGGGDGTAGAAALCLAAALSYALAGVWGRRFGAMGLAPLATAFGMLAAASLILAPAMLALDRPLALPWPEGQVVASVAALALLSTACAYLLYFRLLARVGAVNLLLVTFLIPVSALLAGCCS